MKPGRCGHDFDPGRTLPVAEIAPAGSLIGMLAEGSHVPDVTVFDRRVTPVSLPALAEQGPLLLVFYLYDWTRT